MKKILLFSFLLFSANANAQNSYHQNTMYQLEQEANQRYMMNNMAVRNQMIYNNQITPGY